jgi:hypothetical protein
VAGLERLERAGLAGQVSWSWTHIGRSIHPGRERPMGAGDPATTTATAWAEMPRPAPSIPPGSRGGFDIDAGSIEGGIAAIASRILGRAGRRAAAGRRRSWSIELASARRLTRLTTPA